MKSKIRQLIACAATFIMVSMSMEAQTSPVYSVPSPEAANLGTYGSVPVSLFTGIPDISVPIHEMRVGSMTFPRLAEVSPCLGETQPVPRHCRTGLEPSVRWLRHTYRPGSPR